MGCANNSPKLSNLVPERTKWNGRCGIFYDEYSRARTVSTGLYKYRRLVALGVPGYAPDVWRNRILRYARVFTI